VRTDAIPPRVRSVLIEAALAVLLLCAGVVVDKTLAWIGIAVALTLLAVFALSAWFSSRARRGGRAQAKSSAPSMSQLLTIQKRPAERTRERRKAAARNVVRNLELEREHRERTEAEQRERIKQELKAEREAEDPAAEATGAQHRAEVDDTLADKLSHAYKMLTRQSERLQPPDFWTGSIITKWVSLPEVERDVRRVVSSLRGTLDREAPPWCIERFDRGSQLPLKPPFGVMATVTEEALCRFVDEKRQALHEIIERLDAQKG
jgi:hypothetical protein